MFVHTHTDIYLNEIDLLPFHIQKNLVIYNLGWNDNYYKTPGSLFAVFAILAA